MDRWLSHLTRFGTKLGLETPRALLGALGDPQDRFPSVHVAGTNGKGSTCRLLEAVLGAAGLSVGRYTSPHLEDFRERIAVDDRFIGDADLVRHAARVHRAAADLGLPATFFEAATAIAFLHFAHGPRGAVGAAVVEVGLGGRLDATNVLAPRVAVITNVTLDHTRHLGASVAEVAAEKAGIIKPGVPVVTAARGEALDVIRLAADRRGAPLSVLGEDFQIAGEGPFAFAGDGGRLEGLTLALEGAHQGENLALALAAAERFLPGELPEVTGLRVALAGAAWPGRLERLRTAGAPVLLDCAHNAAGGEALAAHLAATAAEGPVWLVLGVLADKDFRGVAGPLLSRARRVLVTAPDSPRAGDPVAQADLLRRHLPAVDAVPGVAAAVDRAVREAAAAGGRVVVAGSVYTVGEARAHLRAARAAA